MADTEASSLTPEHHTPKWFCDMVREVFGGEIECDPCYPGAGELAQSYLPGMAMGADEAVAGKTPCFTRGPNTICYTVEDNGLLHHWGKRTFINAPGDDEGAGPQDFWRKLAAEIQAGFVEQFIWLAFNISHLRSLQSVDAGLLTQCQVNIPRRRIPFTGTSPTRDNAVFHFSRDIVEMERFYDVFERIGPVWGTPESYR